MASNTNDMVDARGGGDTDQTDAKGGPDSAVSRGQPRYPKMEESDFVSDRYNMNHQKVSDRLNRGVAVVINNMNFQSRTGIKSCNGSDVDANGVCKLLQTLGFTDIQRYHDVRARDIQDILRKAAAEDHTQNDCFACFILTHGDEGYVFGVDDKISVDELVRPFKGDVCTSLAGKPKLFIIQASSDADPYRGITLHDGGFEADGDEEEVIRRIPTEADILLAYSVVPGYFTQTDPPQGSWFIQALVDIIGNNWQTMDLLSLLTRVNKKVAFDFESNAPGEFFRQQKKIPCITSLLTKDLYF